MESQGTEGAGSAEGTGATEGGAAAPDTTSQATQTEGSEGTGGESGGEQSAQPAKLNYSEVHAKLEAGEDVDLTEEQISEYEKWYAEGMKPQDDDSQSNTEAPDKASPADGNASADMKALMAEVGAKTPQEVPAKIRELRNSFTQASGKAKEAETIKATNERMNAFFDDLIADKPQAWEHLKKSYKEKTGRDIPVMQSAAQPAQTAGQGTDPFAMSDDEVLDTFMNLEKGRNFLNGLKSFMDGRMQKLEESTKQYDDHFKAMQAERDKAESAKAQSKLFDELVALAEKYPEDYGLQGKPIRELMDRWWNNEDVPELKELFATGIIKGKYKLDNLEQAHAINFQKRYSEKLVQAKINAAKSAGSSAKPTVGIHGTTPKGSSSAELSDADAVAMAKGTMEIPDKYLDDGIPMKGKTPDNLYKLLTEVA